MLGSPKRTLDTSPDEPEANVDYPSKKSKNQPPSLPQPPGFSGDHMRLLATFVPAYRFIGKNTLHSVCKYWNASFIKISLRALFESCQTAEDALNILSDETLWDHLDYGERLTLAGMIPDVAQTMLADPVLLAKLKEWGWDFAFLGSRNIALANVIFEDMSLLQTMPGAALAFMGQSDLTLAKKIFNSPEGRSKMRRWDFPVLAQIHLEMAELVLQTNPMRTELIALGEAHSEMARQMIKGPLKYCINSEDAFLFSMHEALIPQLENGCWQAKCYALLGMYNQERAQKSLNTILNNQLLLKEATAQDLINLSMNHIEIARQIFANPILREKIRGQELAQFGNYHEEIAEQILKDEQLKWQVSGFLGSLGSKHVRIARKIIAEFDLDGEALTKLGHAHASVALQIFADQNLLARLSDENLYSLALSRVAIAQKILENEALRSRIKPGEDLENLERSVFISRRIKEIVQEFKNAKKASPTESKRTALTL